MAFDAASITLIQSHFLSYLTQGFSTVTQYALNLLYIFAVFEVVLFGLFWAMQQEPQWGRLLFKVLKIGLLFFVIANFSQLISTIVNSFADIGGTLAQTNKLTNFIFNPALLWQYGYNSSLALLKAGSGAGLSFGLALVLVTLGIGTLVCFALIGIQIIFQLVSFYLISLVGLVFVPLGVFSATDDMFAQVIRSVLKAGVRVIVLLLVIALAVSTWQFFKLNREAVSVTINQALGLFDTALLFAYLVIRLPPLVANVVGRIDFAKAVPESADASTIVTQTSNGSPSVNIQAASAMPTPGVSQATQIVPSQTMPVSSISSGSQSSPTVNVSTSTTVRGERRRSREDDMAQAHQVKQSVSDDMLKRLSQKFPSRG